MNLRGLLKEHREMRGGGKRGVSRKARSSSHIAPETSSVVTGLVASPESGSAEQGRWANLPPELLIDILRRVDTNRTSWPARRDVVACAAVCRSWRYVTKDVVRTLEQCGWFTFPVSLKQPGPRELPIQCYIRRDRASNTYFLYLGLSPALAGDQSKLLLAAKKVRNMAHAEFLISRVADEFSQSKSTYVGKLRSNFLGTKFTIHDSELLSDAVAAQSSDSQTHLHCPGINFKHTSSKTYSGNQPTASIAYELTVLRRRGPRRMICNMRSIPLSAIHEGGTAPTPMEREKFSAGSSFPSSSTQGSEKIPGSNPTSQSESLVLKNKSPRWHEQLQCWCLNFKGRVSVASVKNFQLVAAVEPHHDVPSSEQERVILQFGKIARDIFTMDFCYPLSAFQAFAVCLSSFDTKPACE
ncbi:hypothetical protein MLD38_002099 [Melastoma candidum]|uniref:Uncharacterized protein n=1 Tax=Melastoma candidum TaxID=119954 RepID=A0ACB9SGY1_9MYRT|nr:hypothetical protein MLD38_002099 [Melastoma candidum]